MLSQHLQTQLVLLSFWSMGGVVQADPTFFKQLCPSSLLLIFTFCLRAKSTTQRLLSFSTARRHTTNTLQELLKVSQSGRDGKYEEISGFKNLRSILLIMCLKTSFIHELFIGANVFFCVEKLRASGSRRRDFRVCLGLIRDLEQAGEGGVCSAQSFRETGFKSGLKAGTSDSSSWLRQSSGPACTLGARLKTDLGIQKRR